MPVRGKNRRKNKRKEPGAGRQTLAIDARMGEEEQKEKQKKGTRSRSPNVGNRRSYGGRRTEPKTEEIVKETWITI